jgi:hypothetical protein
MNLRRRFWTETVLAIATGVLAVVTALVPDWIEVVFRVDPDAGSGAAEWGIVAVLAVVSLGLGLAARREYAVTRTLEA